jgi:hypothetical protein
MAARDCGILFWLKYYILSFESRPQKRYQIGLCIRFEIPIVCGLFYLEIQFTIVQIFEADQNPQEDPLFRLLKNENRY